MQRTVNEVKSALGLSSLNIRKTNTNIGQMALQRAPRDTTSQQIQQGLASLNRGVQELDYAQRRSDAVDQKIEAKLVAEAQSLEATQAANAAIDFSIKLSADYDSGQGAFKNKLSMTPEEINQAYKGQYSEFGAAYPDKHTRSAINSVYNKGRQGMVNTHYSVINQELTRKKVEGITSLGVNTIVANPEEFSMSALQSELKSLNLSGPERDKVEYNILTTAAIATGDPKILEHLQGTRDDGNLRIGSTPKYARALKEVKDGIIRTNNRKVSEAELGRFDGLYELTLNNKTTRSEILEADITPQHKATLITQMTKGQQKVIDNTSYIDSVNSQGTNRIPNTTKGRAAVERGYIEHRKQLEAKGTDPEVMDRILIQSFTYTGIMPSAYAGKVQADLTSTDPDTQTYALKQINLVSETSPEFGESFTDNERLAATIYKFSGNPIEAIRVATNKGEVTPDQRKVLERQFSKDIDSKVLLSELNDERFDNDGFWDDAMSTTPQISNAFESTFKHFYVLSNGNTEAAKELAYEKISKDWSVSELSGKKRVQFMAPESINYGQESNDWLKYDFEIFSKKHGGLPKEFQLTTDIITVNTKGQKSWSVSRLNENGLIEPLRNEDGELIRYSPSPIDFAQSIESLNNTDEAIAETKTAWDKAKRIRSTHKLKLELMKNNPELFTTNMQPKI